MKKLFSKKGYTLVELIVAFALTGILLSCAASTLVTYLNVFSRVNDTALAYTLMDTLAETVAGTVGPAQRSRLSEQGDIAYMILTSQDKYDTVELRDRNGEHVLLHVVAGGDYEDEGEGGAPATEDGGYLELYYYKLMSEELTGDGTPKVKREAVEWRLGAGVYNDYVITALDIAPIGATNTMTLTLEVTNRTTMRAFETTRIIECYNLTFEDITLG